MDGRDRFFLLCAHGLVTKYPSATATPVKGSICRLAAAVLVVAIASAATARAESAKLSRSTRGAASEPIGATANSKPIERIRHSTAQFVSILDPLLLTP